MKISITVGWKSCHTYLQEAAASVLLAVRGKDRGDWLENHEESLGS